MAKAYDRFRAANCGVVVISQGKPAVLADFGRRNGFPFPVLGDPDRVAYKAFGLERVWWWTFLYPWVLWGYLVRVVGTLPRMPYLSEDVTQLGGDFLLDQSGRVLWSFKSGDPSKRPTVDAMLTAVGGAPAVEVAPPPHAG